MAGSSTALSCAAAWKRPGLFVTDLSRYPHAGRPCRGRACSSTFPTGIVRYAPLQGDAEQIAEQLRAYVDADGER
jgi:hypothetical protein